MSRRELWGEKISMFEYVAPSNEDVMLAFAKDVEKGKYAGQIVYTVHTYLDDDGESSRLEVFVGVI